MNADEHGSLNDLTRKVIGAAIEVSNILGAGFLEKVYERALLSELHAQGLRAKSQARCPVFYKGRRVGDYLADLIVEDEIIVELKCVEQFSNEHMAQCINYLRPSGRSVALLLNFQRPKLEWKRIIRSA